MITQCINMKLRKILKVIKNRVSFNNFLTLILCSLDRAPRLASDSLSELLESRLLESSMPS